MGERGEAGLFSASTYVRVERVPWAPWCTHFCVGLVLVQAAGTYAEVISGSGVRPPPPGSNASRSNLLRTMMADRAAIDSALAATQLEAAADATVAEAGASEATEGEADDSVDEPAPASPVTRPSDLGSTPNPATSTKLAPQGGGGGGAMAGERLIQAEDRDIGAVPLAIYGRYLASAGPCTLAVILASLVLSTGAGLATDLWLSAWSTGTGGYSLTAYMAVYGLLTGVAAVLILSQALAWAAGGVNAGRALHSRMLRRVMRAPMAFFDTTPAGRVINRFSSDVATVDAALPTAFASFLTMSLRILGTVALQTAVLPWVLLGVIVAAAVSGYVVAMYRK